MDRLKDKIAMVTGAANGIGKATSELFAEEGAWVLVTDIEDEAGVETVRGIVERGGAAEYFHCDVSSRKDVVAAVTRALNRNGAIDILVNNAAYLIEDFHGALDSNDDEWRRCIDVALMGTHHCTQSVLPHMMGRKRGSIVNVVSIQAMEGMMTSTSVIFMRPPARGRRAWGYVSGVRFRPLTGAGDWSLRRADRDCEAR